MYLAFIIKKHQMFKKSSEIGQLNMFTSPKSLFSGNSLKMYEDEQAWQTSFANKPCASMKIFFGLYIVWTTVLLMRLFAF